MPVRETCIEPSIKNGPKLQQRFLVEPMMEPATHPLARSWSRGQGKELKAENSEPHFVMKVQILVCA